MVLPILTYGYEIWGFHNSPDIERVYLKFLKQILGVRQQTTNIAVYGELGKFPLSVIRNIRIIKFWSRIRKTPGTPMYKIMYLKDHNDNLVNAWTLNVKRLLNSLGLQYLWDPNIVLNNSQVNSIIQRIKDQKYAKLVC
jgi:hypothetical protein